MAEGKTEEADCCIEKAAAVDKNDFTVYTYRQLKNCCNKEEPTWLAMWVLFIP